MGYFSDSRRNWSGAFWTAMAIPLVIDPWNFIWDESGWLEEQFGAPFAPLGPSGGNDYFTPDFWAGRSSETVGRQGPRISPKVSPIIRGTYGAQSSNLILQKNLPWTPPPPPLKPFPTSIPVLSPAREPPLVGHQSEGWGGQECADEHGPHQQKRFPNEGGRLSGFPLS